MSSPSALRDTLQAFSNLAETLPTWINEISDLQTHTDAKRQEFIEDFKKNGVVKTRRRKGSSLCSIRDNEQERPEPKEQDAPEQTDAQEGGQTSRVPRKRHHSDADAVSVSQSIVSTRYNLIIHYDHHTQHVLTEMVKKISFGRNRLRATKRSQGPPREFGRGRFGGRALRMSQLNNSLLRSIPDSDDEDGGRSKSKPRNDPEEPPRLELPFDSIDKQFEVAHSLSETAAYHFLRSGDCSTELRGILDSVNSLIDITNTQVDRLKEHMKQYNISETEPEPEPPQSEAQAVPKPNPALVSESSAAGGGIEVDDDSNSTSSAEPIDMAAFRVTRINRR